METVIEQPNARFPFLRFLVVASSCRKEISPRYNGGRLAGHFESNSMVRTQKLLGFGSTLKEAQAMAAKKTV